MHLPLWLGISTVFMEKFQLETFCDSVQRYDITHAYVAPPIVLHLAKNSIVEKYDLRSLKMITSGGAPLAAALINELYNRRKLPVRQAYGLSETTSVSHIQVSYNTQSFLHPSTDSRWPASNGLAI
jgi:acyl-coenzyme A synthetase/AMP-(fatty) acid ligase